MRQLGQFFVGLASAFGTLVLVFGALLYSNAEGQLAFTLTPSLPVSPSASTVSNTQLPGSTPSLTHTSPPPAPTLCPLPEGWTEYIIQSGDDLETLAQRAGVSTARLMEANCLFSANLPSGTILYLPFTEPSSTPVPVLPTVAPSNTATSVATPACVQPRGWIVYTVQPKDTLYSLGLAYGVSVNQLMLVNCLSDPNYIRAGMRLFVPNVPTRTPSPTPSEPPPPAPSDTPVTPVLPPTDTVEPSPTDTEVIPSETPTTPAPPTDTLTPTPTGTDTATTP